MIKYDKKAVKTMINENKTHKISLFGLEMEELLDIILERFRN